MEEVIRRYLEDEPETARGVLLVSVKEIVMTVDPGETAEGSFVLSSNNGCVCEGMVLSDEPRLRVLTDRFCGPEEEIGFTFRAEGLLGGDKVSGHFSVISDCGETQIPVTVSVRTPWPVIRDETGEEEMRNLFHFANLARRNYADAVRLFYSPGMRQLFQGADRKYVSVYRGLSGTDERSENAAASVEEFLIAVRKKEPMAYSVDRTQVTTEAVTEDVEEVVRITRRGWGYTWLEVQVDGAFIDCRRERITDRDFLGNSCSLSLVIRYDRMHAGRNFGRIVLKNPYTDLVVEVIATRGDVNRRAPGLDRGGKRMLEIELVRTYVLYRLGRMRSREWLVATGKIVSRMNAMAPDDVRFQLYTAHYLITASRENEAIWVLDRVRTSVEETCSYGEAMRAYFLYLETLLSRENSKISAVEEIFLGMLARNPSDWRIAWLLQFLFDDKTTGNNRRMRLYEEQFHQGCRSPILYIETLDLMGRDPSLLKKIDNFTLYVLAFAAKAEAIPKPLIDRIVWLTMREKQGSRRIYRILETCYREDADSGAVDAICSLLIKDARTDEEAFAWYRRGVENDSRITRLYEYYMSAHPLVPAGTEIPEIPRAVLLYFSYKSELPFDKSAILYRYVIAHREDEPELYQTYVPQMERFVAQQMAKGRIDASLSELYGHFCVLQPQDPVSAERFFEALYTVELEAKDPDVRRVVVIYDRLRAERTFPVMGRFVRFPLYGSEAAVLYEDARGHRYAAGKGGKTQLSLAVHPDDNMYAQVLPFLCEGNANINLYLTEANRMNITTDNVERYRKLAESDALTTKSRSEISFALIRFYYDNDFTRQLADYLPHSHPERMSVRERSEVMEIAVLSGIYDFALDMIARFGFAGLEDKTIYRLCARAIARGDYPQNETADKLAYAAFRTGKYDEGILRYLSDHFTGLMEEEAAVSRACASFSVDAAPLAARMLTQLMFTGSHDAQEEKLFSALVRDGGSTTLQVAFLARAGREYLFDVRELPARFAERIRTLTLEGEQMPVSCRLAYLKYFAVDPARRIDPEVGERFLTALSGSEIGLPFLYAYRDRFPALALTDGMRYVEIAGLPGRVYTIYCKRGGEYVPKTMQEPYPGFYTHGEILFPGDEVRYFITVRDEETDRLCRAGMLCHDLMEDPAEGESLYALTSRMVLAKTQNDRQSVRENLYLLYKNNFLSRKLFPLPGE